MVNAFKKGGKAMDFWSKLQLEGRLNEEKLKKGKRR